MKIRALIVDDEPDSRESIQLIVNQFFNDDVEIVGAVGSVKEAVRSINELTPDLVLLDVEMPNENGFQLFEYFGKNISFDVVFITAYQEYALSAFRYAALDYLLKPVDYRQFEETIRRVRKNRGQNSRIRIDTFFNNLENDLEINKKIILPTVSGYNVVKVNSILYIKADLNYSIIFTADNKSHTVTSTLKHLEDTLPASSFFRCHKSFMVNLNFVKKFDKRRSSVILENDITVEVATRRAAELEDVLKSK
jgi:two-component system LytT family response regulator